MDTDTSPMPSVR